MPIKHKRVLSAPKLSKGATPSTNGVKNAGASYARVARVFGARLFQPASPSIWSLIIDNDFEMNFQRGS